MAMIMTISKYDNGVASECDIGHDASHYQLPWCATAETPRTPSHHFLSGRNNIVQEDPLCSLFRRRQKDFPELLAHNAHSFTDGICMNLSKQDTIRVFQAAGTTGF